MFPSITKMHSPLSEPFGEPWISWRSRFVLHPFACGALRMGAHFVSVASGWSFPLSCCWCCSHEAFKSPLQLFVFSLAKKKPAVAGSVCWKVKLTVVDWSLISAACLLSNKETGLTALHPDHSALMIWTVLLPVIQGFSGVVGPRGPHTSFSVSLTQAVDPKTRRSAV